MGKVKTFLHVFTQSLFPQPHYYRKLRKAKFWFSLKYFIAFIFTLNAVFFGYLFASNSAMKPFNSLSLAGLESAMQSFPTDLSIEINEGRLTANTEKPYFIWGADGEKQTLYGVVSQTATPEQVAEFEAPILFTGENIVLADRNQEVDDILPYANWHMTIDKAAVETALVAYQGLKPFLVAGFILFILVLAPLFAVLSSLGFLFVVSLACFVIYWVFNKKHSYQKTLQISLHAVTVPYLTKYGLLAFGYNLDLAWPVFAFLVAVFILSGLHEAYTDK